MCVFLLLSACPLRAGVSAQPKIVCEGKEIPLCNTTAQPRLDCVFLHSSKIDSMVSLLQLKQSADGFNTVLGVSIA